MKPDIIHGDRRIENRYHFEMELRFSYRLRGVTYFGAGYTRDLSRSAVLFHSDTPPEDGVEVEMHLAWPFLLQGVCPLDLVVWGKILKTDSRGTVVEMRDHEFRTIGERSFGQQATAAKCEFLA